MRSLLVILSLSLLLLLLLLLITPIQTNGAKPRGTSQHHLAHLQNKRHHHQHQQDPMEPCYLANNRASESLTISESTPVGTVVGEIMVNGDSSAAHGNIELSIRMPAATTALRNGLAGGRRDLTSLMDLMPPLSIEPDTKRLILAKKLDRENLDKYIAAGGYSTAASAAAVTQSGSNSAALTVHIKCQLKSHTNTNTTTNRLSQKEESGKLPPKLPTSSILIPVHLIVTDENDNCPVFLNGPYIVDLNESAPIGSLLLGNEIFAVDNDQQGPLSTIEYSLVGGSLWSDSFAFLNPLDARSLIVRDPHLLDYEAQPKITLKVLARDQGEPPNWAISPLYINLLDQDDLGPRFGEDQYQAEVRHNRPGETIEVLPRRLVARDADRSIQAPIIYSFHSKTNHSIHFELDPDLGRLTLKKSLPESSQSFCLLVKASQLDRPGRFTLAAIQMRLGLIEDTSVEQLLFKGESKKLHQHQHPQELKFNHANYTVEMSEASAPGATVIQLKTSSLSSSEEQSNLDQVEYQLLDDDLGQFHLDQRTGRLSLNKSLDYELYRSITVRVLATRTQTPTKDSSRHQNNNLPKLVTCDTARVNVQVLNHNEHSPEFSHEQYNFQLSVSDLIANFDPPPNQVDPNETTTKPPLDSSVTSEKLKKRALLLESETTSFSLSSSSDDNTLTPDFKSMLLGQIYCADRDLGDKINLQLKGSKAQLFHLSPDGHLYLPLVNQSQLQRDFPSTLKRRSGSSYGSMLNDPIQTLQPDRQYLNYLLGELSNLGRLRMKVLASDDGQTEKRQSSALIVITILSIDSFISFHQHHHQPLAEDTTTPIQLTNETSYDTSASDLSLRSNSPPSSSNQLMLIPATNGRSYVQINPDIIGNLIHTSSSSNDTVNSNQLDQMLASDSNLNKTVVIAQQQQQPPSLLVVDDEGGAKFVAMPQAIEVYQQQVQEQQARVRHQQQRSLLSSNQAQVSADFWWPISWWRGQPGQENNQSTGLIYWLNASTALMLHLITVGAVVALLSRLRHSSTLLSAWWPSGGSNLRNGQGNHSSSSGLFTNTNHHQQQPSFFSSWSLSSSGGRANRLTGAKVPSGDPPSGLAHSSTGGGAGADLSLSDNGFGFLQSNSYSKTPGDSFGSQRSTTKTSCGVLVSAMSTGSGTVLSELEASQVGDKQLYGQLKTSLNKMLDQKQNKLADESNTFDGLQVGLTKSKKEIDLEVSTNGETMLEHKVDPQKSSTFVGPLKPSDQNQVSMVSISISAAPKTENLAKDDEPAKEETKKKIANLTSSSSSSVVSLVSLSSSSISNKIAASVERAGCGHGTGSDISSLDSNSLFTSTSSSGLATTTTTTATGATQPPPPPPPPPPPCMVQAGASSCLDSTKPFSSPPVILAASSKPSDVRRPLPQNPAHIKLRQQASLMSAKSSQVLQFGAPKHKGVQTTTTAPPPPPLPPPLPSSLSGAITSLKTVSPTTSVDRGYESLQSYTSSSHHHYQKSQDLIRPSTLASQKPPTNNKQASNNLRPLATPGNKSQPHQQQPAVGRQAQRQQATHKANTSDGFLNKSTNQNSFSSRSRSPPSGPSRKAFMQQQRQRKLPSSASARQLQHQLELSGCQQLDYGDEMTTTEDDDEFYCCYDEGAAASGTGDGGGEGLLSEYASHAYKPATSRDWQPLGCHHHHQQQHQLGSSAQQQHRGRTSSAVAARGNDLMMIKYHQQQHKEPEFYQQQHLVHHNHHHRYQQPLNKKQLTWSDQVDHLA